MSKNVRNVSIGLIKPNPKNPRLIFDQEKLDSLIVSLKDRGILVPLTVFLNNEKTFTIIDGERRYKAALKLGIPELPVIIDSRPDEEEYVNDMFHIHSLREPWELVPTALKLQEIIEFFITKNKRSPTEAELNKLTGLRITEIRRCKTVLSFPVRIQDLMLNEEAKTKNEKSIIGKDKLLTEDFFIEVAKNVARPLKENNFKAFKDLGGDKIYDLMVKKRKAGMIQNIVALRPVAKYIRQHPNKAGSKLKEFLINQNYPAEKLLVETGLEFDFFKFERNFKVFLGAIQRVPNSLGVEDKKRLIKLLKKIKREIDAKLGKLEEVV